MLLRRLCCDGAGSYRPPPSYNYHVSYHGLKCHLDCDSNTCAAYHYAVADARFADGNLASHTDAGIPADHLSDSYCQRNANRDGYTDSDANANVNANRDTH